MSRFKAKAARALPVRRDAVTTFVITDGLLITGQNPASSGPAAEVLIEALNKKAQTEPTPPQNKKNQMVLAGVGAVLGGVMGAGIAGAAAAALGVVAGGLLGYNWLKRL